MKEQSKGTVINFDKAFGPVLELDLGEPIPDPLTPEEREQLREELEEVDRAQLYPLQTHFSRSVRVKPVA